MQIGTAQASSEVYGIINSDTTWTKANSPYILTGAVGVNSGVTLTIEPGVTVNLVDNYIQVDGILKAKGNVTDRIQFNEGRSQTSSGAAIFFTDSSGDWNEDTAKGSIIENAIINQTSMLIEKASPKINNNTFNCRISTFGGSPLVLNNIFKGGNGIVLYDSNEVICGNEFSDTSQAIYVGGANCAPIIQRNLIVKNNYGIVVPSSTGIFSPIIRNNTIANNSIAIGIAGGGNPSPTIIYNNIYGSTDHNFHLTNIKNNINATQNWWGTTDAQAIAQTIFDYKKDFNLGNVTFVPFLTEPNSQAIPDPNMPTPTPNPMPEPVTPTPQPTPSVIPKPTPNPSPSSIPVPGQSFFFVESNSTITELFFNSTSSELRFRVNGTSGTKGYVKVTVSKSLVSSIQNVKVYLDGSNLNFEMTSNENSWILTFTYTHSTHQVRISLAATTTVEPTILGLPYWIWATSVIIITTIIGICIAVWRKRKT